MNLFINFYCRIMPGGQIFYEQQNKRDPYAFGLGKRGFSAEYGLGKRDPYAFGLGKRGGPWYIANSLAHELEADKRDPYAFGLGK